MDYADRFRHSASRMPEPVTLDPAPIPGQLSLPLGAAGYVEPGGYRLATLADVEWLLHNLDHYGHCGQ